jgi:serine/threonine-protein kinase
MANILYVDDDKEFAAAARDALLHEKHDITVMSSGPAGWNHLKANNYDLVILDWEMPDLDGIEILKLMRSAGDSTPVIMMTARSAVGDKVTGLDAGANDYLTKPFSIEEFAARVRAALRNKAAPPPAPKPLGSGNEAVLKQANLAGTTLAARFEFLEVIGTGGIALVFKARHPDLDKLVAIKMLQPTEFSGEAVSRFVREARIASKLDHPNIVIVYDFGITENKQPYMVMELIEGDDMQTYLEDKGYLSLEEALPILIQTGAALGYAHEKGILHRDIKPANIMLKQVANLPPTPKILDFGLAKLSELSSPGKQANLTMAQQIIGSPPYMSPEQVKNQPVDVRSDIYSLGCVIFQVVTGCPPFVADTPLEVALKRLEEPPLTLAEARPNVKFPLELVRLINRALDRDPEDRYQTMSELLEDLKKIPTKPTADSIWSKIKTKLFG